MCYFFRSTDFTSLSATSILTSNADSNQSIDEVSLKIKQDLIWILHKIISIYFDHSELVSKFDIETRPMRAFMITFDLLPQCAENKTEYLSLVHEYLAK